MIHPPLRYLASGTIMDADEQYLNFIHDCSSYGRAQVNLHATLELFGGNDLLLLYLLIITI
jgi:hypothetical protein